MRLAGLAIILLAALIFVLPPLKKGNSISFEKQAQEEVTMEEVMDKPHIYKVTYKVQSPDEEPIADIIWMKKAAEVAENAGIPYFNVLKQEMSKRFVREHNQQLSIVTGVIQLDNDPMRAEFDAREIRSLVLTDYP